MASGAGKRGFGKGGQAATAVSALREEGPVCVAHRGGLALAPENTLAGFANAVNLGCKWAELDVRASRDGALVVMHDSAVDRTTDGAGTVAELSLRQLKKLDAGVKFAKKFSGERIPTLDQALRAVRGKLNMLVEIKAKNIERQVAASLRKTRMDRNAIVICFDPEVLVRVKQAAGEVPTGLLLSLRAPKEPGPLVSLARRLRASLMMPSHEGVTREFVEKAHNAGLPVITWTVNEARRMQALLGMGVDGIGTDRPDVLLKILARRRRKA